MTVSLELEKPPLSAIEQAELGEIVILTSDADDRVRALIGLDTFPRAYLYVGRFVDSNVIGYVERTQQAAQAYAQLESRRTGLQLQFATIFVIVTLLLLLIAVGVGLGFANQLTRPIARLVRGAELVRSGNIGVHIDEAILKDGRVDVLAYNPVARLGYMDYTTVTDVWEMLRPG